MTAIDLVKAFFPAITAFFVGIAITPIVTHYLYKYKMWKKKSVTYALDGTVATISQSLHRDEEKKTPRMGGIVVWGSVLITTIFYFILSQLFPLGTTEKLNFLSRSQTWLPLFTLIAASIVGLFDDISVVRGTGGYIGGGIPLRYRIAVVVALGLMGAWWFMVKLESSLLFVPFYGTIDIGWLFAPLFVLVMLAIFSGGVIDGIDGLSGGALAATFGAYMIIALFREQIDLAAFIGAIVGGLFAFLWFNIPPARFYMSETGMLGLTTTLTVVAFMTDAVLVLPIIAFPLFVTSGSVILQMLSKKFRGGKKIFLVAPLHHHFQALGWPAYKVTMRFWIVSFIAAIIGVVVMIVGTIVL